MQIANKTVQELLLTFSAKQVGADTLEDGIVVFR
jgi:hypothetical protein